MGLGTIILMKDFLDTRIQQKSIHINNSEKNINFLRQSYKFAEKNSTDTQTWTGAIITKENKVLSTGANRFAERVKITEARKQRPKKYLCQNHAERDAIFLAAKDGIALNNSAMFMPWVPCCDCANGIIASGIKTLVIHYEKCIKTPTDWIEDIREALSMLQEAQVSIEVVTEKIGDCTAKFRGEIWYP